MIKICISVTSHALDLPSPCHKLSHLLGPPPPSSVTYFMDGPYLRICTLASMYMCAYVCMHICMGVCILVYMYIYVCNRNRNRKLLISRAPTKAKSDRK